MAFGQFVVHAMSPGLVNAFAARGYPGGHCDRAMVNGLFLSWFYLGAFLGSFTPGMVYGRFGWTACYCLLQSALVLVVLLVRHLAATRPELRET